MKPITKEQAKELERCGEKMGNRIIKFRYVFENENGKIMVDILTIKDIEDEWAQAIIGSKEVYGFNLISRDEFTGLKDKNGNEIFEGDILEFGDFVWTVEWKNDRLGFGYSELTDRMLEDDGQNGKIIGNIHERKEDK